MSHQKPITSKDFKVFHGLTIREIESHITNINQQPSTPENHLAYRAARQALSERQHYVKAECAKFELTNNRHLLIFDSTSGFYKMIGHSVLFFSLTIANRIHWRYSIKADNDHYSISEDGVISIRSLERLASLLSQINIYPDKELCHAEFHFFELHRVYTENQIANLRDNTHAEDRRITRIILPKSPIPQLYDAIVETSRLTYYYFQHSSDQFARATVARPIIHLTYQLTCLYLAFAESPSKLHSHYLLKIISTARELRHGFAYINRLHILHSRDIRQILDQIVVIERLATNAEKRLHSSSPSLPQTNAKLPSVRPYL